MHHPTGIRDGPTFGTWFWSNVGKTEVADKNVDKGRRAVERGGEHHEGGVDEVQEM